MISGYKGYGETTMFKSLVIGTALSAAFLAMSACSFVGPWNQSVTVLSEPDKARVEINGIFVGVTPLDYSLRRNQDLIITLSKEGYHPVFLEAYTRPSAFGMADIAGGFLIGFPFLGLLSPAAWMYDPSTFSAYLSKTDDSVTLHLNTIDKAGEKVAKLPDK